MDIAQIKIIKLDGYNDGAITTMEKHRAEQLQEDKKVKILKILSSNKLAPEGSEKKESTQQKKNRLKAEEKAKEKAKEKKAKEEAEAKKNGGGQ